MKKMDDFFSENTIKIEDVVKAMKELAKRLCLQPHEVIEEVLFSEEAFSLKNGMLTSKYKINRKI